MCMGDSSRTTVGRAERACVWATRLEQLSAELSMHEYWESGGIAVGQVERACVWGSREEYLSTDLSVHVNWESGGIAVGQADRACGSRVEQLTTECACV